MGQSRLNGLEFEHVQQRTDKDCGVACLAMYARVPYERALEAALKASGGSISSIGMSRRSMVNALRDLGINAVISWKFFDQQPTIVCVPSLNFEATMHFVFWDADRGRVLDPQAGREGKRGYEREHLYRGWSWTIVDIDAAAEGMGMSVERVTQWVMQP
jgi:ABC-type bacteriocin/lantibiotic exporter with double-glycine peptidase domain